MTKLFSITPSSETDLLANYIVSGAMEENIHIATDEELADNFGVSRLAMKKAKRELQHKGLIKHRRGKGYFVEPRQNWNLLDADILRWHLLIKPDEDFLNKLFDIRIAFEPSAARLAAIRASVSGIKNLTNAYNDLESCALSQLNQQTILKYLEADAHFHRCILENAGNVFLTSFNRVVQSAYLAGLAVIQEDPEYIRTNLTLTKELYLAIKDRIPEKAEKNMTNLLLDAAQKMGCDDRFNNRP